MLHIILRFKDGSELKFPIAGNEDGIALVDTLTPEGVGRGMAREWFDGIERVEPLPLPLDLLSGVEWVPTFAL